MTAAVSRTSPPGVWSCGVAFATIAGVRQGSAATALFRGFGAPLLKSLLLLSVSEHPTSARRSAVVFVRPGAAEPSEQLAAP